GVGASAGLRTPRLELGTATTGIGLYSAAQRSDRAPCGPPGSLLWSVGVVRFGSSRLGVRQIVAKQAWSARDLRGRHASARRDPLERIEHHARRQHDRKSVV